MKCALSALFILCFSSVISAQEDKPSFIFGLQGQYGDILAHSDAIEKLSYTNPIGIIADAGRLNTSVKSWSVFSAYWIHGIQAGYYSFQNKDTLGGSFIVTAFAEPLLITGDRFCLSMRGGAGLSYQTEIYDEYQNPDNKFFCTRIAFPIYVALRLKYRISGAVYLTLSGYYNHISNGGIRQPNYGMNFPCLSVGAEYVSGSLKLEPKSFSAEEKRDVKGWYFRGQMMASYKVVDADQNWPEKGTLVSGINLTAFRRVGFHYALGAGAEYVNDRALKVLNEREGKSTDHKRIALTAGQDFHFGKVIFSQHFGFYVYSPSPAEDFFYQMYGLGVRLHPRIMTGVFMKAHGQNADFMGVSVSWLAGKIR